MTGFKNNILMAATATVKGSYIIFFFERLDKEHHFVSNAFLMIPDIFKARLTTYKQITLLALLWERTRVQLANNPNEL